MHVMGSLLAVLSVILINLSSGLPVNARMFSEYMAAVLILNAAEAISFVLIDTVYWLA